MADNPLLLSGIRLSFADFTSKIGRGIIAIPSRLSLSSCVSACLDRSEQVLLTSCASAESRAMIFNFCRLQIGYHERGEAARAASIGVRVA
jgi:hypothetical protein